MTPFVKHVRVEPEARRQDIENPQWTTVEGLCRELGRGSVARIELFDGDDVDAMMVHGEGETFHICIVIGECEYYLYSNGQPADGQLHDMVGRYFEANQICHDRELMVRIVRAFWEKGEPLSTVRWIHEVVGGGADGEA